MDSHAFEDESEETFEPFVCCICLDLLYKPVVLSCGHISCFWCVHKSMSGFRASHCPICRHPYYHFPAICQLLHFLLLKIYPDAYKRRENQTLEQEEKTGLFSPKFVAYTYGSQVVLDHSGRSPSHTFKSPMSNSCSIESFKCMEQSGSTTHIEDEGTAICSEHTSNRTPEVIAIPDEGKFPQNEHNQQQKILIADVTCIICEKLFFHPVVLNSGHVYCQTCVINIAEVMLKCQVCKSLHPRRLPKVCLVLNQYLEEHFPEEYAQRRNAIQLDQIKVKPETTSCSLHNAKGEMTASHSDPRLKVHIGVGCDFCGLWPIIGDRYKCLDCEEKIGFDLCGDCRQTGPNLPGGFNQQHTPGRFNQQHTPEHRLVLIQQDLMGVQLSEQELSEENFVIISGDPVLADEDDQNDSEATN